jgi:hypothetical protein
VGELEGGVNHGNGVNKENAPSCQPRLMRADARPIRPKVSQTPGKKKPPKTEHGRL